MEGNKDLVMNNNNNNNNALNDEDMDDVPVIMSLPAVNAPPGGPCARLPFRHDQIDADSNQVDDDQIWDEDHLLPLAGVMSTMLKILPADADVPCDVANIIQRGTSDFILLVTSQARELCKLEGRQSIKGDDLIKALKKLGFTNYVAPLELYLARYRSTNPGDRSASSSKTAQSGPSEEQ